MGHLKTFGNKSCLVVLKSHFNKKRKASPLFFFQCHNCHVSVWMAGSTETKSSGSLVWLLMCIFVHGRVHFCLLLKHLIVRKVLGDVAGIVFRRFALFDIRGGHLGNHATIAFMLDFAA